MKNEYPKRKKNRLEYFDYSTPGAYFITVCSKDKRNIFWEKKQPDFAEEDNTLPQEKIKLTHCGKIVEESIKSISDHYENIKLSQYVIMPNHVHLILFVSYENGRIISSPTTVITAVGQMKRTVSKYMGKQIWQRSFHDHVIRNNQDYEKIKKYMYENPAKWQYDCFYNEDYDSDFL